MGYYQFIAVMDHRTTPMCQSLDCETFPIVELNQGAMHVRCKSTICASIDDGKHPHNVTEEEARSFIKNAYFAIYSLKAESYNFYGKNGGAFVQTNSKKFVLRLNLTSINLKS